MLIWVDIWQWHFTLPVCDVPFWSWCSTLTVLFHSDHDVPLSLWHYDVSDASLWLWCFTVYHVPPCDVPLCLWCSTLTVAFHPDCDISLCVTVMFHCVWLWCSTLWHSTLTVTFHSVWPWCPTQTVVFHAVLLMSSNGVCLLPSHTGRCWREADRTCWCTCTGKCVDIMLFFLLFFATKHTMLWTHAPIWGRGREEESLGREGEREREIFGRRNCDFCHLHYAHFVSVIYIEFCIWV